MVSYSYRNIRRLELSGFGANRHPADDIVQQLDTDLKAVLDRFALLQSQTKPKMTSITDGRHRKLMTNFGTTARYGQLIELRTQRRPR